MLGLPAITALNLAARLDTMGETATEIQEKFSSLFEGLGNFGEEYDIQPKPGLSHMLYSQLGMCHSLSVLVSVKSFRGWKSRASYLKLGHPLPGVQGW